MERPNSEVIRAAVVQASPVYLDLEASVERAVELIGQAARQGARLVVFPELWLPGYPWWLWLAPPAWAASTGIDAEYRRNAVDYDAPPAARIAAAARRHRLFVSMGLAERDRGSLYIAQWLIGEDGTTIARRRKLKPGAAERALFGEGDARDLRVDHTSIGRIGALCCAEHRHPLFKFALFAQHEQIHVAAWPSFSVYQPFSPGQSPSVCLSISRMHAVEGGCFVLAPSSPVTSQMLERVCDTEEKGRLLGLGGGHSAAFDPHGTELAAPLAPDEEGILLCDLDFGKIRAAKGGYDVVGHAHRPDVVGLRLGRAELGVRPDPPAYAMATGAADPAAPAP